MDPIKPLAKIARGMLYASAGIAIARLLNYIFRFIIARLGPADYGLYSLGTATLELAVVLSMCGFYSGIQRFISQHQAVKDEARTKGVLDSAFRVSLPLSILLSAGIFLTSNWISINLFHNNNLEVILKIFAISIPFVTLTRILIPAYTAFQKIEYTVLIRDLIDNAVRILLILLAIHLGYGLVGVVSANTLGFILVFIMAVYLLEKKLFPFLTSKTKSMRETSELLLYSLPLMFSGFFTIVISYTDTLMLGYFKTASDVGLYNVAFPTARLLNIAPTAILSLFLVVLTELHTKGDSITKVYKSVSRWITYINVPLLAVILYAPKEVLSTLFGSQYATAAAPLVILATICFLDSILMPASHVLEMFKKTRTILLYSAMAAALNIALNYLLIPRYGIMGAASATGLSIVMLRLLMALHACKLAKSSFMSTGLLKAVTACMIAVSITHLTLTQLQIQQPMQRMVYTASAITLIYITGLLALKAFESEDKELLKNIRNIKNGPI